VLTVGYDLADLRSLCTSVRTLATIDNRWHLDNEERGRTIALCHLPRPLATLWNDRIARDEL
jgi:hypothetical protein